MNGYSILGLRLLFVLASIVLLSDLGFTATEPLVLSNKGKAVSVIVADPNASEAEATAAAELKSHLDQITGGDFQIVDPGYKTAQVRIHVGPSPEVKRLLPDIDFSKLPPDTIIIAAKGRNLILAGDRPRGTIYAVYTFLEDYLGCNWWDQTSSSIPTNKNIVIKSSLRKVYSPAFTYRSIWYHYMEYEKGAFGARLKLNGVVPQPSPKFGGHIKPVFSGHSLHYILPPDLYFASHPEWYGLYNGIRQAILPGGRKNQLCLSNAAMTREFTARAIDSLRSDPEAKIICVVQEDGAAPCNCPDCSKMSEQYGGASGVLMAFVNKVADKVKELCPGVTVETFAYQWSLEPPKAPATGPLKKRSNVTVRIAPINEDFGAPWPSKRNSRVDVLFQEWKKYGNLSVYDYAMNYHQPLIMLPNWNTIGANIKYYADNAVKSVVYQGDICNDEANFCRLRAWLLAHLLWDLSSNQQTLIKRFMKGYYGKAGTYLQQYIEMATEAASQNVSFLPIWSDDPCFLTSDQLKRAKTLLDKAQEAVKDNEVYAGRVKIARLGFDHQLLLSRIAIPEVRSWVSEEYRDKLAADFVALSNSSKNNFISETVPMPDDYYEVLTERKTMDLSKNLLPAMKKPADKPAKVIEFSLADTDWTDIQENQFQLTASNREIVADPAASNLVGIKMPGGVYDWILQAPVFTRNCIGSSLDLYVSAKINTTQATGLAFKIEVYDMVKGTYALERWVDISEFGGETGYKEIKIGTFSPIERQVIVCAPYNKANVTDFILDRFFLVKN